MTSPLKIGEKPEIPAKCPMQAESPTTVKPFDMDDDDPVDAVTTAVDVKSSYKSVSMEEENPPAKPPRPLSSQQQAENTLREAFPSIDATIVKAILRASSGQIEPAFNALLGMSDPEATRDLSPSPSLSRPLDPSFGPISQPQTQPQSQSQLEADERYARQLADHYRNSYGGTASGSLKTNDQRNYATENKRSYIPPEERSFIDDDLPIIKENLKKGFLETQSKVNNWITTLRKKIDGDDDEYVTNKCKSSSRSYRSNDDWRRKSDDYSPYDADPQVLGDDFAGIQMNADGTPAHTFDKSPINPSSTFLPRTSSRRNPSISNTQGKYDTSPSSPEPDNKTPPRKQSKWQPLSKAEQNANNETDNDPFSLGDTDDEKEVKDRVGGKESKVTSNEASARTSAIPQSSNPSERMLESSDYAAIK